MSIRFIDDDDRTKGSDIVGRFLAEKYIDDCKKKEADEKAAKDKAKKPAPKTVTVLNLVFIMMALSPFVTMIMTSVMLTAYINWVHSMKDLIKTLPQ